MTILGHEAAVYRCLVDVDGRWRALGTLTREECFTAAASYRRRAAVNEQVAEFLDEVGRLVKGSDVVESAIGADDLAELGKRYADDGPGGLLLLSGSERPHKA